MKNAADLLSVLFAALLSISWVCLLISWLRYKYHVAPKAVEAWCERNGLRLEEKRERPALYLFGWFGHPFRHSSTSQLIYQIRVRDQSGNAKTGWVRLGGRVWPSLSVDRCPLEVEWADDDRAGKGDCKRRRADIDDWPEFRI